MPALSSMSCQYLNAMFFSALNAGCQRSIQFCSWLKVSTVEKFSKKNLRRWGHPTDAKATDLSDTNFFNTKWQKKNNKHGKPIEQPPKQLPACRFFLNFLSGTPPKHENCWFTWKGAPLEKGETSTNHQFWNHRIIENPNQKKYSPEIPNKVFPFLFKGLFQ